jgi:Endonuclease/Exonuclease/phosphatase family
MSAEHTPDEAMLVRSWNVYHGRSDPPGDVDYLEDAVRLACAGRPHVLCLQEVPPWALERLSDWSGMRTFGDVTRRPSLGPIPLRAAHGRRLTSLRPKLFRSAFSGQANAILVRPELAPRGHRSVPLNPTSFRRRFSGEIGLRQSVSWGREPRKVQLLRLTLPDDRPAIVANLHATHVSSPHCAEFELERALELVDSVARAGEVIILAGDFNLDASRSTAFDALAGLGFSQAGPAIDHVFVRGAEVSALSPWASERRRRGGVLLSDHAPVELTIVAASP